jgi:dienelactone hydrolase
MSEVFGNHRQRGTLRFLSYHALYQETRHRFVIYAGSVKDGERFLGLHDGQVDFDSAAMTADVATRHRRRKVAPVSGYASTFAVDNALGRHSSRCRRALVSGLMATVLVAAGGCGAVAPRVNDLRQGEVGWVTYPSSIERIDLRGELRLPGDSAAKLPAMVIVHGSGGLDQRNDNWAAFLRKEGFATFQFDYFGPRGVTSQSRVQPIPTFDAYDALRLLATHPRIDAARIGIIGFSRGGDLVLSAVSTPANLAGPHHFAAHVALYPACWLHRLNAPEGSGSPVLILSGTSDEIAPPLACEGLVDNGRAAGRDATLITYEGAHHAWDSGYTGTRYQPSIGRSYSIVADSEITERSHKDVLAFLRRVMK